MALVLPALTDCRWWFESLLVHSGVSSATRRKATGADHKKIQHLPSPIPPDSPFLRALGTTAALKAPPQTDTLAQRALEEWERTLCENKAVAILAEVQAGRPTIIHKDGGEMLIAIVLDRPLAEAKELVDDPAAFTREMTRILRDKQAHPLIAQMMRPAESSDPPPATAADSGASSSREPRTTSHVQFQ